MAKYLRLAGEVVYVKPMSPIVYVASTVLMLVSCVGVLSSVAHGMPMFLGSCAAGVFSWLAIMLAEWYSKWQALNPPHERRPPTV